MSASTIQGNVYAPANMGRSLPLYYKWRAKNTCCNLLKNNIYLNVNKVLIIHFENIIRML
jgi:hypothetical protein